MSFRLTCLLAPSSRRSLASMMLSKVTSETSLPNSIAKPGFGLRQQRQTKAREARRTRGKLRERPANACQKSVFARQSE
jgi:hypothetical protein